MSLSPFQELPVLQYSTTPILRSDMSMSTRKTLHMIGNAHLDPVWLWRWPEGFEAARATFRSALDRMGEDPGFVFTSSQAAVYQWIERGDPELFARIRERVQEGRWRIAGGWWMQTDCNIPSGESLVRQALYAQRYFMEKLGVMATVGYNVDSFGHNAMIPQILKKSGMDAYVFMRPGPHENPNLPGRLFWWESPDGSRVLTCQIHGYAAWGEGLEDKARRVAVEMSKYPAMVDFYGVGNHGGGPTKDNLERIHKLQQDDSLPEIRFSAPDIFFDSICEQAADLPVWRDDMQHHASGCYAAHSEIKRNNRRIEHLLEEAEKLSVMAQAWTGLPYPHEDLTRAWQAVLFNQFHDIMAGTSIREAYDDARDLHGLARQIATEAITFSTRAIASRVDTSGDGTPIVVFNPHSWTRTDHCEVELHDFGTNARLTDERGMPVRCQVVEPSAVVMPGGRTRICFQPEVPPMGYRLYRAFPEEVAQLNPLSADKLFLENERLRVDIDPSTGQITGIRDKEHDWNVLVRPMSVKVIADPSDTWSHDVFRFDDIVGAFGDATLEVVEEGPVCAAVRATSRYGQSTLTQTFRVYAGGCFVECDCRVDWHEQQKILKLSFPVDVTNPIATYEIQYGHIKRPADGEEEPGLAWVDVSDDAHGLCLVNDAKYSYDIDGGTINLTVLRSPVYAHHDPRKLDPDGHYHYIDQGVQEFKYRLFPHQGWWQDAHPHRLGCELNSPLVAVSPSQYKGTLAVAGSFLSASADNVIVSVIKQAEDGNGIVLRAFETDGQPAQCTFTLAKPSLTWQASFGPCEIKTFLVNEGGARETNLLELADGYQRMENG